MTKTKGESSTTAKIKELTGVKPEKISEEQLKKLKDTINAINRSQLEIGMNEIRKHEIMHGMAELRDSVTLMQKDFEKEYGTFDINVQDGTINYPKENGEADKKD